MTSRLTLELKKWRLRTVFGDDDDLVFAHPDLGVPLVSCWFNSFAVMVEVVHAFSCRCCDRLD